MTYLDTSGTGYGGNQPEAYAQRQLQRLVLAAFELAILREALNSNTPLDELPLL